jgi:hypothetical protein
MGAKAVAAATAGVVATAPVLIPAERRGVELAADVLRKVEKVIEDCAVHADQKANEWFLEGESPSDARCRQIKEGYGGTWATFLGNRKHVAAWLCLREVLPKYLPKKRFVLEPRFMFNPKTQRWEYMDPNFVSQIVSKHGFNGLVGTLIPDIVILDADGYIIHVYDYKFPCPESNDGHWDFHKEGRWEGFSQGDLYREATGVKPLLVTPREGVIRR